MCIRDRVTSIGYADLCSEGFMEAIEPEKWGYMEENGLMTDILTLKEKGLEVSCINVSCGYYNAHTDEEITVKKDLMKSLLFVEHIICLLYTSGIHAGSIWLYTVAGRCRLPTNDSIYLSYCNRSSTFDRQTRE